ncbi:MAG: YhbY family RNA-binding protein [Deltaproteobacteria bacterium]|nr:YhbY family RNA-binding protein [Deltaproteobacteria bacterium]
MKIRALSFWSIMMEKKTDKLEGFQRKYLRGLAHKLKPVVSIGQKGITDTLNRSINRKTTK